MVWVARPVIDRLLEKVIVDPETGCWEWQGSKNWDGYGKIYDGERYDATHRVTYKHYTGAIPESYQIDHLCRNHGCCAPAHLEAVTPRENQRRGLNGGKTHCKRGHEFTPENTYLYRDRRNCRTCVAAAGRRYQERRKAA